jgi:hypothetical protein
MPSVFVKTEKWLAVSGEIRRQERAPICASLRKCTGQDSGIKALSVEAQSRSWIVILTSNGNSTKRVLERRRISKETFIEIGTLFTSEGAPKQIGDPRATASPLA